MAATPSKEHVRFASPTYFFSSAIFFKCHIPKVFKTMFQAKLENFDFDLCVIYFKLCFLVLCVVVVVVVVPTVMLRHAWRSTKYCPPCLFHHLALVDASTVMLIYLF